MPKARALALLVLSLTAATAASAQPRLFESGWNRDQTASGALVDVQVLVDGHRAPLYVTPGQWDRHYFEAFHARNYALRIRNRTGERVGVLIAVDGLNVVNGERSALRSSEPMYILDPWETATIRGWRSSLEQIHEFVFVDEERSYASRTDQANGDMGWIRVLAFQEERPVSWYRPWSDRGGRRDTSRDQDFRSQAENAPRAAGKSQSNGPSAPQSQLEPQARGERDASGNDAFPGTGWGDRRHDTVREVRFDAARDASDTLVLRYEYDSGLRALGIFPDHDRLSEREHGDIGFARPPRW